MDNYTKYAEYKIYKHSNYLQEINDCFDMIMFVGDFGVEFESLYNFNAGKKYRKINTLQY
ncbi:hypothetical protein Avbf_17390 [Armadillidium vulgare]|nr:hypothetical protein Avbf_17390 [Armadillidium vulgare]